MNCSDCKTELNWENTHQLLLCSNCKDHKQGIYCNRCECAVKTNKIWGAIVRIGGININPGKFLMELAKIVVGIVAAACFVFAVSVIVWALFVGVYKLGYFFWHDIVRIPQPAYWDSGQRCTAYWLSGIVLFAAIPLFYMIGKGIYTLGDGIIDNIKRRYQ